MTERERYEKFVEKFNKWADLENNKVLEAANSMGLQKPVIKEKIQTLPSVDTLFSLNLDTEELLNYMRGAEVMGKEQMLTMELTREKRRVGVISFIDTLGDPSLSASIRKLNNYQIQALITKDVVPTYIPYVEEGRYTKEELIATVEKDGYNIEEVQRAIRDMAK